MGSVGSFRSFASMLMCDAASITPGMTNLPAASTISAPAGTATFAPTATILPPRMTTVPFGIAGPLTGSTVPPRIATARSCAESDADKARSAVAMETVRTGVRRILPMLLGLLRAIVDHLAVSDHEIDPRSGLVPRSVEDHEVRILADGDAANSVGHSSDLRRVQRHHLERFILGDAVAHRERGAEPQPFLVDHRRVGVHRDLDAGLPQLIGAGHGVLADSDAGA